MKTWYHMNDPQPEGHMAYIRRRNFLATLRRRRRQEEAGVLFAATKVAGRALGSASKFSASVAGEDATALTARVSCLHSRSLAPERIDRARRWLRTRCRRPRARGLFCLQRDIRARSP